MLISKHKDNYFKWFFLCVVLGFELRAYTLSHSHQLYFCNVFFQHRVSRTICLGWLQIWILLISVTWVARELQVWATSALLVMFLIRSDLNDTHIYVGMYG
jgi:hypothetical protein